MPKTYARVRAFADVRRPLLAGDLARWDAERAKKLAALPLFNVAAGGKPAMRISREGMA